MADQKLVKIWLQKANNDFLYAKASLEEELKFFDLICFHLQQAAEKYLKAYIVAFDLEFKKIHDLGALVEICKSSDSSFAQIQEACLFLQRFYIEPRYPTAIMYDYDKEDADKALESAETIRAFITGKLSPNQKGFAPIIILLAVVVLAGLAGVLYLSKQSPQAPPVQPPSQVPTQTIDQTADWKTYTSSKYGYSIQYPPTWKESIKCQGGTEEDDYMCLLSPDFEESALGAVMGGTAKGVLIWIDGQGGLVGSPPDEFCQSNPPNTVSDCQQIMEARWSGWSRRIASDRIQVGILKNGKFVLSFQANYNSNSEKEIIPIFNQILSTFRFTDQNKTNQAVDWKTYTNSIFGYSFKYPGTLEIKDMTNIRNDVEQWLFFTADGSKNFGIAVKKRGNYSSIKDFSLNPELFTGDINSQELSRFNSYDSYYTLENGPYGPEHRRIYLLRNQWLYVITMTQKSSSSNNIESELVPILATFRFD